MPRRPKLPGEFVIESLSTGREVRAQNVPDDFGAGDIPIVQDMRPIKPLLTSGDMRVLAQRKQAEAKHKLWAMLKPDKVPELGKQVELIPKGKRKIAEWGGKAVLIDMPKWRRL